MEIPIPFEVRMNMLQQANMILQILIYDLSDEDLTKLSELLVDYEAKRKKLSKEIVNDNLIPMMQSLLKGNE